MEGLVTHEVLTASPAKATNNTASKSPVKKKRVVARKSTATRRKTTIKSRKAKPEELPNELEEDHVQDENFEVDTKANRKRGKKPVPEGQGDQPLHQIIALRVLYFFMNVCNNGRKLPLGNEAKLTELATGLSERTLRHYQLREKAAKKNVDIEQEQMVVGEPIQIEIDNNIITAMTTHPVTTSKSRNKRPRPTAEFKSYSTTGFVAEPTVATAVDQESITPNAPFLFMMDQRNEKGEQTLFVAEKFTPPSANVKKESPWDMVSRNKTVREPAWKQLLRPPPVEKKPIKKSKATKKNSKKNAKKLQKPTPVANPVPMETDFEAGNSSGSIIETSIQIVDNIDFNSLTNMIASGEPKLLAMDMKSLATNYLALVASGGDLSVVQSPSRMAASHCLLIGDGSGMGVPVKLAKAHGNPVPHQMVEVNPVLDPMPSTSGHDERPQRLRTTVTRVDDDDDD